VEKTYQSVLHKLPGVAKIVQEYGRLSLEEYSGDFFKYEVESLQPRDDLIDAAGGYARRLLGAQTAAHLERRFADTPVALTANHHGVDYKSLTMQGTIIFGLPALLGVSAGLAPVVPVLAFGIVPLNNLSFPRGIVLSREKEASGRPAGRRKTFVKVPVIPVKFAQSLVSAAGPFTGEMVSRALKEVERLFAEGAILESERKSLAALLHEEYAKEKILALPDYSDQAVALNSVVWKRMFAPALRERLPELAYLEAERLVAELLEKDLQDEGSLLYNLLFDQPLREELLSSLDKKFGCWDLQKLQELSARAALGRLGHEEFRGCGTVFFWQVDDKARRVPLILRETASGPVLSAISAGEEVSVSLTPQALSRRLRERRLLPGLFTSFTAFAFARGLRCYGGFFQVDYLPAMQRGLRLALEARGLEDWAKKISVVPTANFVTGMNIALAHYPDGEAVSAGAVEIIAAGGLSRKDLERISTLTVEEANLAGLLETYTVFSGENKPVDNWSESLKELVLERCGEKLARFRL